MLLFQVLWGLYTSSTAELGKARLIIPASDAQCLHLSPLKLRSERGFILLGLGNPTLLLPGVLLGCCRTVTQRESTFQNHTSSFVYFLLIFIFLFPYSSNFWTHTRCPHRDTGYRDALFGHGSGRTSSGAFSDFSQEAPTFQGREFRFS